MKYKKADGKVVLAAWSEAKDVDMQITFSNSGSANLEFSACQLGYGSLNRHFVKGAKDAVPKFDLIARTRPWVMEGDLNGVNVAALEKHDFPESQRLPKVEKSAALAQ